MDSSNLSAPTEKSLIQKRMNPAVEPPLRGDFPEPARDGSPYSMSTPVEVSDSQVTVSPAGSRTGESDLIEGWNPNACMSLPFVTSAPRFAL
jgi:hypothetical protein